MPTTDPAVASSAALTALRTWLAGQVPGATLTLTDDLLGGPLPARLFGVSTLTVREARAELAQPTSVGLTGVVDLLGALALAFDLRMDDATCTVRLTGADDRPIRLSAIVTTLAGAGVGLPPEVPDLAFTELTFVVTPGTGAFSVDGGCAVPWSLPFGGGGLPVGSATLHVGRTGEADPVGIRLGLASAGALAVTDGLRVTGCALTFQHEGEDWQLAGSLDVDVLDRSLRLSAALHRTALRQEFAFRVSDAAFLAVDLADLGSLSVHSLGLTVARELGPGAAEPVPPVGRPGPEAVSLDGHSAYRWTVDAEAHLELVDRAIMMDGTLTVAGEPGALSLELRPGTDRAGVELTVALPGAESVLAHLGLDRLTVARRTAGWTVSGEAGVWFAGLPGGLDTVLPDRRSSQVTGTLELVTGEETALSFSVAPVLPVQSFRLPDLAVGDLFDLDLSAARSAIEVGRLEVRWTEGSRLDVSAELAIGIPAELNQVFGTDREVFVGYQEGDPESLQRLTLTAGVQGDGRPTLSFHLLTSPLRGLVLTPAGPDSDERQATLDLGECGTLRFTVPSVSVAGDTFRAAGSFAQENLALPLSPLKWVTSALGLSRVNDFLPDRLPLEDLRLYDTVEGLDVDAVVELVTTSLKATIGTAPGERELRSAVQDLATAAHRLPERLKPYLNVRIPRNLDFALSVSAEGAILGEVGVTGDDGTPVRDRPPLRLLLPGLSALGPMLTGIELWNLEVGEILGGAALLVRADLNLDQFDLLPLAALLGLPEGIPGLPDPSTLTRRLVVNRLTLLVVPEAFVALPLFVDDLAVEYRGVEGAELGARLSFPAPELELGRALDLYHGVKAFLTDRNAVLTESMFHDVTGRGLDLQLTAGPAFLRLPGYLGGDTYGSRTATSRVSAASNLVPLLNGLKTLRLDQLLGAVPTQLLRAGGHAAIGPLDLTGLASVGPVPNDPRAVDVVITAAALLTSIGKLGGRVELRTVGSHETDLGFSANVQIAPTLFLGGSFSSPPMSLTLSGSVDTMVTDHRGVLRLDDANARVTAPGPTGRPDAFTVEWWLFPTQLWDYNQFVSLGDRWGAFVFHTTALGEVYCGTDVATRFTPADLPAGTVRRNVWQHFAFTYRNGTGRLFRDGVELAVKQGMSAPQSWTGLRLGIPDQGTQVAGSVADVRVWSQARSVESLQQTRYTRLTGREPGLIACWPMNEEAGDRVLDRGPQGWHGVARGARRLPARPGVVPPLDPEPGDTSRAVAIRGTCTLDLFGGRALTGTVTITDRVADLAGRLDLFPGSSVLRVTGDLVGRVEPGAFRLHGTARVNVLGLSVGAADLTIDGQGIRLSANWFDLLTGTLIVDASSGRPRFGGAMSGHVVLPVLDQKVDFDVTLSALVSETLVSFAGSASFRVAGVSVRESLSFSAVPSRATLVQVLQSLALPHL